MSPDLSSLQSHQLYIPYSPVSSSLQSNQFPVFPLIKSSDDSIASIIIMLIIKQIIRNNKINNDIINQKYIPMRIESPD